MMDSLLDQDHLSADEQDYLDVLSDLVERYESAHHFLPPVSDAQMLEYLLEAKGVTQAEAARGTSIAESTISAVRAGKRKLSRALIGRLAHYFHVGPGVFRFEDE
jgi:HTH-type transcriptional regulator/antitoxin HigA